jgi:hypothetical protein
MFTDSQQSTAAGLSEQGCAPRPLTCIFGLQQEWLLDAVDGIDVLLQALGEQHVAAARCCASMLLMGGPWL